ncbi:MAG TPA: hypothetical protein VII84_07420 [Acidimicrobiales bacterium]
MSEVTPLTHPSSVQTEDIVLRAVTKYFGSHVAVHDLDLDIARGEFFTMLGPHGSSAPFTSVSSCPR